MLSGDAPIRRKLTTVILLTTGAALLVMCTAFVTYEFFSFRQNRINEVTTLGKIISDNSTAALAFGDKASAMEILSALKAEGNIVAAVLYDEQGNVFCTYPSEVSSDLVPRNPSTNGEHDFNSAYLSLYQPVMEGNRVLGTLYLRSSMNAVYEKLWLYLWITVLVATVSILIVYFLSRKMQQSISKPILALAETAAAISAYRDYSVRCVKMGNDELGLLTDAFNQMLSRIEEQTLALRRSKEKMENIVQGMGDAYISLDRQWNITFANEKAGDLVDKIPDELLNNNIRGVFDAASMATLTAPFEKVMQERNPCFFEIYYTPQQKWFEVRVYPHEEGVAVFYTDISKYKKAEEDIRIFNRDLEKKIMERTDELESANKELESFSYSVSHDLRAPLRAIHGYMSILYKRYTDKLDQEGLTLMNNVLNSSKKMGRLIDDLLQFSRLGRKELSKSTVNMRDMASGVFDELIKLDGERNIEVVIMELPHAHADYATIRQVWLNLISNAIKYTQHTDKARIEIGAEEKDTEIVYYVRDNGAGFDMEYYDKLFGVFQRLHSQREFDGTGVGLAIVQRVLVKHGGTIWAKAKPNEGAEFFFTLPVVEVS